MLLLTFCRVTGQRTVWVDSYCEMPRDMLYVYKNDQISPKTFSFTFYPF